MPPSELRHVARVVPLSLAAAAEALADAGLEPGSLSLEERRRIAVVFGSGGGPVEFFERMYGHWYRGDLKKASVYSIPTGTIGTLSSEISMRFGLKGPSHVVSTGCTSSADAMAYAAKSIAHGERDVVLSGGADAVITPGIMTGFALMKILSTGFQDRPAKASRPFDAGRDGFVLGEGAWIFVLEELERARARGARIRAEVLGYGATCDAFHRVRLDETGEEPARAMREALEDAGLSAADVSYVQYHGTSTVLNDRIETRATKLALGEHARRIPGSSVKSQIGHPQGASGAAGIAATLRRDGGGVSPRHDQPRDARPGVRPRLRPERRPEGRDRDRSLQRNRLRVEELGPRPPERPRALDDELLGARAPSPPTRSSTATSPGARGGGEPLRHRVGPPEPRRARPPRGAASSPCSKASPAPSGAPSPSSTSAAARDTSGATSWTAFARRGGALTVLGLRPEALPRAPRRTRSRSAAGDALRLPVATSSVDIVFSTLFLHHFSAGECRRILLESRRVARRAVIAFDLSRHRAAWALISVVGPLAFRTPISTLDGKASVLQAYTPSEISALASDVLPGAAVRRAGPFVWQLVWTRP